MLKFMLNTVESVRVPLLLIGISKTMWRPALAPPVGSVKVMSRYAVPFTEMESAEDGMFAGPVNAALALAK